jgi:co-chaperonin GroES (HSP10)
MHTGNALSEDAAHLLRDLVRRQPCVSVGDDVLFSHDAGQETVIDNETYIILREAELLAVVEPEGAYV